MHVGDGVHIIVCRRYHQTSHGPITNRQNMPKPRPSSNQPTQQDSYSPAVALLLAQEAGGKEYKDHWAGFLEAWTSQKGNEHVVTSPKG